MLNYKHLRFFVIDWFLIDYDFLLRNISRMGLAYLGYYYLLCIVIQQKGYDIREVSLLSHKKTRQDTLANAL
jgi:hypothetical protein